MKCMCGTEESNSEYDAWWGRITMLRDDDIADMEDDDNDPPRFVLFTILSLTRRHPLRRTGICRLRDAACLMRYQVHGIFIGRWMDGSQIQ